MIETRSKEADVNSSYDNNYKTYGSMGSIKSIDEYGSLQ